MFLKRKKNISTRLFVIRSDFLNRWTDHFSLTWLDLNPRAWLRTGNRANRGGDRGFLVLQSLAGYVASSQVPRRSKNFHPCPNNISTIEFYNYRRKKKEKERIVPLSTPLSTNFPQFLNVSFFVFAFS